MDYFAEHIKNTMIRLGIEKYHQEHIVLSGKNNSHQNEFLFLINDSLPLDTRIESDSEFVFKQTISGLTPKLYLLNYFTGDISLTFPDDTDAIAEFIRVIPDLD